jgi:SAM-dependent methyltransferase
MDKENRGWVKYWNQDDFWKNSLLWRVNAEIFLKRAIRLLGLKLSDSVLDIGCGVGYLEFFLSPLVKSICAVDVAQQFVDLAARRCRDCANVEVRRLSEDNYTNLEVCPGPFSVILCVSVLQYYRNLSEVESLIRAVKILAAPGAQMLIADLPVERSKIGFIWDGFCSCVLSIRGGYFRGLLATAYARWLRKSGYKSCYNQTPQLLFTATRLKSLIQKTGLRAKIIKGSFSVYANRLNLLVQF